MVQKQREKKKELELWSENILQFLIQVALSSLIFVIIYRVMADDLPGGIQGFSILTFLQVFSQITAILLSMLLVGLLSSAFGAYRKGVTELRSWPSMESFTREAFAILMQSLVVMAGLYSFISSQSNDFMQLFMLWFLSKMTTTILAAGLSFYLRRSILGQITVLLSFGSALVYGGCLIL